MQHPSTDITFNFHTIHQTITQHTTPTYITSSFDTPYQTKTYLTLLLPTIFHSYSPHHTPHSIHKHLKHTSYTRSYPYTSYVSLVNHILPSHTLPHPTFTHHIPLYDTLFYLFTTLSLSFKLELLSNLFCLTTGKILKPKYTHLMQLLMFFPKMYLFFSRNKK